jgi:hypothetical protein
MQHLVLVPRKARGASLAPESNLVKSSSAHVKSSPQLEASGEMQPSSAHVKSSPVPPLRLSLAEAGAAASVAAANVHSRAGGGRGDQVQRDEVLLARRGAAVQRDIEGESSAALEAHTRNKSNSAAASSKERDAGSKERDAGSKERDAGSARIHRISDAQVLEDSNVGDTSSRSLAEKLSARRTSQGGGGAGAGEGEMLPDMLPPYIPPHRAPCVNHASSQPARGKEKTEAVAEAFDISSILSPRLQGLLETTPRPTPRPTPLK